MSNDPHPLHLIVGGISEEAAHALAKMIESALDWRCSIDEDNCLEATDALVESIDKFTALIADDKWEDE